MGGGSGFVLQMGLRRDGAGGSFEMVLAVLVIGISNWSLLEERQNRIVNIRASRLATRRLSYLGKAGQGPCASETRRTQNLGAEW